MTAVQYVQSILPMEILAQMVNNVNFWLVSNGFSSQVSANGANDIELTWNSYTKTKDWLDGYEVVGQYGCSILAHCQDARILPVQMLNVVLIIHICGPRNRHGM